jgi:hypothetical protein
VQTVEAGDGHITVPVTPERRGTVWSIEDIHGSNIKLLNIPPVLALGPDELLLPKEVLPEIRKAQP